MLPDLDETLKQLLIRELPIPNGEVEISFDSPKRDWAAGRVKPTLNLYLYDLRENTEMRRTEWIVERDENGQATKHQPPKRIAATYLVTAWAGAVEDEHRLLWRALAVLMRYPELPRDLLQGDLAAVEDPLRTHLLPAEEIPNPSDMWSALNNELRAGVHYRVMLPLDVARRFVGPIVFTKEVQVRYGLDREKGPVEEIWQVAGIVRDAKGQVISGAMVEVKERGLSTESDAEGRYTFPNLDPGSYTFVVTARGGKPREQKVVVGPPGKTKPSPPYDLTG